VSGKADNFRSFNSNGHLFNAGGQLNYSGGQINIASEENTFTFKVNGTLFAAPIRSASMAQ
jgi:hypothetical protein